MTSSFLTEQANDNINFYHACVSNRRIYFSICYIVMSGVYGIIVDGIKQSDLPGIPTISRMLVDQYNTIPFAYVPLVIIQDTLRNIAIVATNDNKFPQSNLLRLTLIDSLGSLQTIFFLLILVADVDYFPTVHVIIAASIVAITLIREAICIIIDIEYRHKFKTKLSFTLLRFILDLILFANGLVFFISSLVINDCELLTYYAICEHVMFLIVVFINVFYVTKFPTPSSSSSS